MWANEIFVRYGMPGQDTNLKILSELYYVVHVLLKYGIFYAF